MKKRGVATVMCDEDSLPLVRKEKKIGVGNATVTVVGKCRCIVARIGQTVSNAECEVFIEKERRYRAA